MVSMTIRCDVNSCEDCPHLKYRKGINSVPVPFCDEGYFGYIVNENDNIVQKNEYAGEVPKLPPSKCKFFSTDKIDDLCQMLNVKRERLDECIEFLGMKIDEPNE